jgi:predicted Holliday junction resolvase-like endonuclease
VGEIAIALLVGLVAGVIVGAGLTYALLRKSSLTRAQGEFDSWHATELRRLRREALADGRADLKHRVGDEVTASLEKFPFVAADVRFIGDPVAFVVFDGHTEVKDRSANELRTVAFVSVSHGSTPSRESLLVKECVADGRVSWRTLTLPGSGPS